MADAFDFPDYDESLKPKTADPYEDTMAASKKIDKLMGVDRFQRSLFEREWFRNVLFAAGQQWVIYERGRWRPRVLPAWFPRAQTNKFFEKALDISNVLLSSDPTITYEPASGDPADQAVAEVGEAIRSVLYEEAEIDDLRPELAMWIVLTGNAFLIPYYDMDPSHGTQFKQGSTCMRCANHAMPSELAETGGMCPSCLDEGVPHSDFQPAQDPDNQPIGEDFPIGALQTDVVSPFEMRLDHRIRNWKDQRRFVRMRRYDLDFAREQWPDFGKKISSDYGDDLSQYYLDVLAHVTGSFSASGGFIGGGPGSPKNPKVTAYEFYELPSEDFPEGLRAVRLGKDSGTLVEIGPLDWEYGSGVKRGQKFLPGIHFGFDTLPGRFWKKTRMDDLIPLQIFRNTTEANLRLSMQRMGNAQWLNPKGSGVSIFTGEPGQVIEYNPVSMGGTSFAKPEKVEASLGNVQPLIILMNKIDDSMEKVAGTFFLQGGETPPGVTAASALSYLGEKAEKTMSPLLREWAKGWKRWEQMSLEIARAKWDDNRLRIIAGKNRKWDVQKFTKADLEGAVNIKIDYNSLYPKSNATERATIQMLIQMGILNPMDPETNWLILQAFGETKLKGSIDLDVHEAVTEADLFSNQGMPPTLIPLVQNSTIHLMQHTDFAKTDEFKEMDPTQQQVWIQHIQATVLDIFERRKAFGMLGIDPDAPELMEVSSGQADTAMQAEAQEMGSPNPPTPGAQQPEKMQSGQPARTKDIAARGDTSGIKGAPQPPQAT